MKLGNKVQCTKDFGGYKLFPVKGNVYNIMAIDRGQSCIWLEGINGWYDMADFVEVNNSTKNSGERQMTPKEKLLTGDSKRELVTLLESVKNETNDRKLWDLAKKKLKEIEELDYPSSRVYDDF